MREIGCSTPKIFVATERACPKSFPFGHTVDEIGVLHGFVPFAVGSFFTAVVGDTAGGGETCPREQSEAAGMRVDEGLECVDVGGTERVCCWVGCKGVIGGGGGGDGSGEELSSQWSVVCCLDTSLEILLDILEIRSKQVYEELVRAFVEGDDNGDGVLSFDEFEAIIQNKKPEFSSRRALRMFKMALESGGGNSTAIERSSFVRTCKQFGLGKLVMLDDL